MNKLIIIIIIYAFIDNIYHKNNVYTLFLEGIKEGLQFFITIFPTLLLFTLWVNLLLACGLLQLIQPIYFPIEIYLMAILRPVSSQTTLIFLNRIYSLYGIDHPLSILASIIQTGSDTTLYVVSLYYAKIKHSPMHSIIIGLCLDAIAFLLAICIYCCFF